MNDIKSLKPFTRFLMTIGELPSSYLISMTYEEQLLWFCNYLEKTVIPTVNNNAEAVIELQNYIKNYFDNLDVQEEINNKLDDMAESGQLTDIIAQYLELAGVLAYNTKAELKAASNISEGSICKTLGNTTYNDGYGNFYKIRTVTSGDVVDDDNILALTVSDTLIAEKIPNGYINDINTRIDNLNRKKYIFMGDSYAQGFSPDGTTNSWASLLVNKMNLSQSDYIITAQGGYGFSVNRPTYNYISLLENLTSDNNLTDMYVCGGYNDATETQQNIIDGIEDFITLFNTKFPNAKLHIGFIGWANNSDKIESLKNTLITYKKACNLYNLDYMNGVEYALHNYFKYFASDNVHPNQTGQNSIANALYECINNGNANIIEYEDVTISNENVSFSNFALSQCLQNGVVNIGLRASTSLPSINFTTAINISGTNFVEIGNFTNSLIIGTNNNYNAISVPCVIAHGNNTYSNKNMIFVIKNKKLYVGSPGASGGSYTNFDIKNIQITSLSGCFNALCC